jgi:hypothetical protein
MAIDDNSEGTTGVASYYGNPIKAGEIFFSPNDVWTSATKYFIYCKNNPVIVQIPNFNTGLPVDIKKPRAMSIEGFCNYLRIPLSKWRVYSDDKRHDKFHVVCEYVAQVIFQQNYELAAVKELDSALIIRKLGLADKREEKRTLDLPIFNITPIEATPKALPEETTIANADIEIIEEKPLFNEGDLDD